MCRRYPAIWPADEFSGLSFSSSRPATIAHLSIIAMLFNVEGLSVVLAFDAPENIGTLERTVIGVKPE